MKQLKNITRLRANDPPSLEKGGPNKVWCYKTIKNVSYGKVDAFEKWLKKSYDIEYIDFNQLDIPFNHSMFTFGLSKLAENYQDTEEYRSMKIIFHAILGKKEEEVWFLVKIIKLVSITPYVVFEGVIPNNRYKIVRANNSLCKFTIADFPVMNLNYLITITKILGDVNNDKVQDRASNIIGYSHTKSFIYYYFPHLELTNFEFSTSSKKNPKFPNSILKGKMNIDDYEDGEIIMKPKGVVFQGKDMKGGKNK